MNFHDISYNGIWLHEYFDGNVIVVSTIPKGIADDGSRKLEVPIVIVSDVLKTIDKLNALFREKDKRLIFKQQPDRFYIARLKTEIEPSSAVRNSELTLEFEVPDGFAHAVNPDNLEVTNASVININNEGNEPTEPIITITHKSDNGWIGLINETGVFGVGVRESLDMDKKPSREILIPNLKSFTSGRTTTIPTGDLAQGTLNVSSTQVTLGAKGPWGNGKMWCGGYNVASIPPSGAGVGTGDKRFYARFQIAAETGKTTQTGLLKILFLDSNNKIVAMYDVHKGTTAQNKADFILWYGGNSLRRLKTFNFTPSAKATENSFRASTHGNVDFEKVGARLNFFYWGKHYGVTVPELADTAIAKVGIFIGQYGTRDLITNHFFTHFKVKSFFAEIKNLDKIAGVKNTFLANDELMVDTAATEITVNGEPRADLFAKGGDFLTIPPGKSQLIVDKSEWSGDVDVQIEFRKRW